MSGKLTTWTLAAIKERNMALEGYCETQGCGQFYVYNLDGLIDEFGRITACRSISRLNAWSVVGV